MSFWMRATYTYPAAFNVGYYIGRWISLGHVSETGTSDTAWGSRKLAMWFPPLSTGKMQVLPCTYSIRRGDSNIHTYVDLDPKDFDGQWIFVYMSHGAKKAETMHYLYFTRSDKTIVHKFTDVTHTLPPAQLGFYLSNIHPAYSSIQGTYFNPRYYFEGESYLGTQEKVEEFRLNRVTKPTIWLPTKEPKIIDLLKGEVTRVQTETTPIFSQVITDAASVEEYAIYGWLRW